MYKRQVRSLKYGGSSDGYSQLYRKLLVVGGLSDKQQLWPQPLARYMQVLPRNRLAAQLPPCIPAIPCLEMSCRFISSQPLYYALRGRLGCRGGSNSVQAV